MYLTPCTEQLCTYSHFGLKNSAYEIWLGKFGYIGCLENTYTYMRTHVKLNCAYFHKNYCTIYIRVTL